MASLRFFALLLALFCIFLMQEGVESGFMKRGAPNEPISNLENFKQEYTPKISEKDFRKLLKAAEKKNEELASEINMDVQTERGWGVNANTQLQEIATKVTDEIHKATADYQKED